MRAQARRGATVLSVLLVAVAAGCVRTRATPTSDVTPTPLSSVSPPTDPGVDYRDPTAVCLRFAAAVYRRDAATDPSAQAAYRRAMAYATSALVSSVAGQPEGRDAQWATWRAHRATSTPTATALLGDDDQPPDGVANAYRAATVSLTPVGTDGWHGPAEQHDVYCTLRHDDGGWRLERYDISDHAPRTP